ncbi:DegV family protein (plasmid) [Fusobacterium vincentii]|uniref:DegV family protein n=1 Tax=Fusobacterium nucleatum TaxID=851 RepID=A0AAX3MAU5_FUSNU|nr:MULTISPECIES: DegV family protein [Fusobacterium]ALF19027.1 DAK2 domain fusion protein YloV [Fusobacterium vincentii ChDC F8]MCG6837192.1 DegV family protein [Fusobacterium nucleatum]MDH2315891.1 DegV family protein [Fusobacterium nucleatum]PIH01577.1 DAK2 domain fusion protein YloV [Fusobacterium vincentii]QYR57625.1 DegV family protein [Fusobacterium vincentii]
MKIEIKILNPVRLTKLFIAASRWLSKYADVLNDLNVYPVPDGDTGTNMSMTLQSVENALVGLQSEPNMEELVDIISEAVLLGARGNSGTILSQIIQGFLDAVRDKEEIDIEAAAKGFVSAKERAYKAVSQPVEGTILTVIRKVSEAAMAYDGPKDDFIPFLVNLKNAAADAVEDTPNLLPKLKEAGVVDAGGKGIFYVLEGFEKSVTDPEMLKDLARIANSQVNRKQKLEYINKNEIKFKYCTEFIIESGDFDLEEYKAKIQNLGDSMVVAQTRKKTKTHIHTNHPGQVLEIAGALGDLNNMKIENMEIQHSHVLVKEEELNKVDIRGIVKETALEEPKLLFNEKNIENNVAIYAVVDNKNIANLFLKDGASAILIGGQTKNPSVSDIEEGLKKIHAKTIYILPNNKNIIASAKLAAKRDKRDIIVIDTKTMLEGYYFTKNRKMNLQTLLRQLKFNNSIEITKAVRDTKVNDIEIKVGDNIALVNGTLTEKAERVEDLIKKIYEKYTNDKTLAVTVVRGKTATEEGNEAIKSKNFKKFYEYDGEQDNYSYYIYLEQRDPSLSKIAILTDSASDITPDMIEGLDVTVIPIRLKIGENNYKDGVNLSKKEFWHKLLTEKVVPKTAQPSPAEFRDYYEELFNKGYEKIISIHISSKMSGTQQVAKVAREMLKREKDIIIVDSKSVTFGQAYQVLEAAKMIKAGVKLEDILTRLYEIADKMKVYFAVSDLTYLEKGGRIGRASSVIGNLLKLRPVLKLEDGEVSLETKTFGERGAISYMEKIIKNEGRNSIYLYTAWGGTNQELHNTDILKKTADTMRKIEYKGRFEIGATIGSHSGPVFGIGIISKIR